MAILVSATFWTLLWGPAVGGSRSYSDTSCRGLLKNSPSRTLRAVQLNAFLN
jgi:hypothetical protein